MIHLALMKPFSKSIFQFTINVFHFRKVKAKRFNLRKTWFTKGLAKSVKKKNILYHCFLNNPNSSNENAYKSYKNKLTHSLRVAKRLHYKKRIEKLKLKILTRNREKRSLSSIFRATLKIFPIQKRQIFF